MTMEISVSRKSCIVSLALTFMLIGTVGCSEAASNAAGRQAPTRNSEAKKDRGHARFSTAGATWIGSDASARQKGGRLSILASKTERDGDKMKRDQLTLNISDFSGPGQYKANRMSMFVRVSINLPEDKDAPVDTQKTFMDALGDTGNIRLADADIEVSSVSDGYIDGRFSIERPAGTADSSISEGQFHARIRE
jgi:hypothetical protein